MNTNIYNHLISTYRPKPLTKYDTHKASELRYIVNKIAKLTQESPTYLVKMSNAKQSYVIGVKESAIMLQNGFEELCDDAPDSVFNNKKAYSSDLSKVGAEFVNKDNRKLPDEFSIKIENLATSQINKGKELYSTGKGLSGGTYKFQVNVGDDMYDFQYNIRNDANNREVMEGLSSFINKAKIGIHANVEMDKSSPDRIHMRIESDMTGSAAGEPIFTFYDKDLVGGKGIVSFLDLNRVERSPMSSKFYMDGVEKHTLSNEFTVSKCLKISLREPTDEAVDVRYFPDSEKIMGNLQKIADAYNYMIDSTQEYGKYTKYNLKLAREIQHVVAPHKSELESCGFKFDDEDRMSFDEALTIQSVNDGELKKIFSKDSPFIRHMMDKTEEVKLNPMEYVDKVMGTYPNYGKPTEGFAYITSFYSGLIFNYYC